MSQVLVKYRCLFDQLDFYLELDREVCRCPKCGNYFAYQECKVNADIEEVIESVSDIIEKEKKANGSKDII